MSPARSKTRKSPKQKAASPSRVVSARKALSGDGPARIRFNRDCQLFAFDGRLPLKVVLEPFMLVLAGFPGHRMPGTEWLLFGGTSTHWRGFTTWVGVSEAAMEAVGPYLQPLLPAEWSCEVNEFCNPSREANMAPVLRVSDDGVEVLEGSPRSLEELSSALLESTGECFVSPIVRPWVRAD